MTPTEIAEVNAIAKIYEVDKSENSKQFLNSIIETGTVGTAAKGLVNLLKAIPGLNIGASVLNAAIAGIIVALLGEGSAYAYEQVYLGNKTINDIDWVKKLIEAKLTTSLLEKAKASLSKLTDASSRKEIFAIVIELIANAFDSDKAETKDIDK